MTKKCLNDLINIFLLDELRMDVDRHCHNYILYKKYGEEKYQGVIPFDLEQVAPFVRIHGDYWLNYYGTDGFKYFLNKFEYDTYTPIEYIDDELTYAKRVKAIMEHIQNGDLTNKSISLLKKEIEYDFPEKLTEICKNPYLRSYKDTVYELYSRLWEYNRDVVGKELGI